MLFSLPPCSRQEPEFACSKQNLKHAMLPSVSLQNRYIRVMFASSVSNNINIITPRVPVVSHITIFDVSTVCSKLQLEQFAFKITSTKKPCLYPSPSSKSVSESDMFRSFSAPEIQASRIWCELCVWPNVRIYISLRCAALRAPSSLADIPIYQPFV